MSQRTTQDNPRLDPLTLPLKGSRLIEASAGTGKTFTIALLYVRAILAHGEVAECDRMLSPRDILVVTFTDAATKELRDRIRQRLAEAAEVFRQPPDQQGDGGPLYALRNQYPDPDTWPAKARLLQLAAESMDEASVHTIHGWCNRMLREHAFDSGGLFNQSLETDQSELVGQVARDYWRTFVTPLGRDAAALWLQQLATPERLREEVTRLLGLADRLPVADKSPQVLLEGVVGELRETFDTCRPAIAAAIDDFYQVLEQAKAQKAFNGTKLRLANVSGWLETLREWAQRTDLLAPDLTPAAWKRLTPEGLDDAWRGNGAPEGHPLVRTLGRVKVACERPVPLQDLLIHACHWVAARLEREKQRRAEMGFDDLLHRLDRALQGEGGDRLARTIRRQFPLTLIDEFQDTDPVQYRIFDAIFRIRDNDASTGFLMIGDPKQAIYAFRGADIFTYLKARDATAGRHVTLPRNFRSAQAMVEASNQVFRYAETVAKRGAFLFRSADGNNPVPFGPVEANGRPETFELAGQQVPAMTFWSADSTDNKADVMANTAEACASEIVRLLNLGQEGKAGFRKGAELATLKASDIAILVNTGREAGLVRTALDSRGVKSVYLSDRSSVLDTPQARDVLYWLEACAEPERDSLVRAALATATLDVDWATLDQLRTSELAWEAEIESFRELRRIWRRQGVLAMIRRLLNRFEVPSRLLQKPEGERILTDVMHIAELLQQESLQVDGEQSLIRHFSELAADHRASSELTQVRLESDADLVQVVTVHKSKGLEYPLVFLPFATSCRPAKGEVMPIQWHDDRGELQLSFELNDDLLQRIDQERLGEDIRKLYVALTRARHATWVGAPVLKGEEARSALSYLAGQADGAPLASCLERMVANCTAMVVAPLPPVTEQVYRAQAAPEPGPARIPARAASEDWWIASYSAIRYRRANEVMEHGTQGLAPESETAAAERYREEVDVLPGNFPPPLRKPAPGSRDIHGFHRGAGPGTFLHHLLEWCTEQGFSQVVAHPEGLAEMVTKRCQSRGWEPWAESLTHWLLDTLQTPLPLPTQVDGSRPIVRLAGLTTAKSEMEFWIASRGVNAGELDDLVRSQTLLQWGWAVRGARPTADPMLLNGMLKGFIDLVFEHDGRYYVGDYKSNYLGPTDEAYTAGAMARVVAEKRYDLQYALYLLALHRLLKSRLPDYDYDRHIGGAVYLFLRGNRADTAGVHCERPPRRLIEQMDELFHIGRIRNDGVMEQEALL